MCEFFCAFLEYPEIKAFVINYNHRRGIEEFEFAKRIHSQLVIRTLDEIEDANSAAIILQCVAKFPIVWNYHGFGVKKTHF